MLVLLPLFFCPAYADNVKELQNKQKKLQEGIEQTNKMLKQTKKDESATMNKLQLLNKNIQNQKKLIRTLDSEIVALNREMNALGATRDSLQGVLEGYKADYAEMVRQSHFAQVQQSPLLFLMSSDSFQQLARRARYLQEFARYRQQQVRRIEDTQAVSKPTRATRRRHSPAASASRRTSDETSASRRTCSRNSRAKRKTSTNSSKPSRRKWRS